MSDLEMDPAKFPAPVKALYERIATRRRAKGEGFGGPYLGCGATENLTAYRFARACRIQYFFCGGISESMPIMRHTGW